MIVLLIENSACANKRIRENGTGDYRGINEKAGSSFDDKSSAQSVPVLTM